MVDIIGDPVILLDIHMMLGFGVYFCVGIALILVYHWRKR